MFTDLPERVAHVVSTLWRQSPGKNPVSKSWYVVRTIARQVTTRLVKKIPWPRRILPRVSLRPLYPFITRHFFALVYPLNFALSLLWRNKKYQNSVLHISYMVHIPWYATRIQRKNGMKADYLAVGGESPWWKQFDYHFPRSWPPRIWQELVFFWKVVARYEVIHAHFGIMLSTSGWEIPHLKRMGRKIVVHYRGCEVRDPVKNAELHPDCNICQDCDYGGTVCREGKVRVDRANAFGDAFLVTTPDMQDFEPDARHFPFFTPAIDYQSYRREPSRSSEKRPFKIVHATNHPGIEGTAQIEAALERLRQRGYDIDFVFLKGATPDAVLHEIASADLTIGKMKMGYYANAQIESMFLGVPAITRVRPEFMTPELERSGLIFTDLEGLEETVAHYIDHPDALEEKRKIARSSILELHDNDRLAAELEEIYAEVLGRKVAPKAAKIDKTDKAAKTDAADSVERPLRVLHIGNIANNAYYNAKLLRRAGVEADVLCYDDYWVMSSPEWEEADFEGVPEDHYLPDWGKLGLRRYQQPKWFAQGPFKLAVRYLLAKQQSQTREAGRLWKQLAATRRRLCRPRDRRVKVLLATIERISGRLRARLRDFFAMHRFDNFETGDEANFDRLFLERCDSLIAEFAERFPEREDRLELGDLTQYRDNVKLLSELFDHYDVVQGYATDPVYPMLAGFRPYVGFEHGTLRDAPEWEWDFKGPFHANAIGRITALSYAVADHVFITNADCLSSAERLRLASYSPMPHPSADDAVFHPDEVARAEIQKQLGSSTILFCPIRHDWIDKGTDRYLRAIPRLRELFGDDFVVCFTPWGREVDRSKALLVELGCEKGVVWVGPFGSVQFVRWLSAADVVFDQLTYESLSGVTPRAIACGAPVISSCTPEAMAWMFADPPPVLRATTVDEIVAQTQKALAPGFREEYREQARQWIEKWHSSRVITDKLLGTYQAALDPRPEVPRPSCSAKAASPPFRQAN